MGNGAGKILTSGGLLKTPWRQLSWDEQNRFQLFATIKEYKPLEQVRISCARILLLGHVNVGKSSFFNTVNSIFRNHVTAQAPVGSPKDQRSITTKMRAYQIRDGREGRVLNFKIVDTMGIEGENFRGFNPSELPYVLDGHVPDSHQFDPSGNVSPEMPGYIKLPTLQDKIHCCVLVMDANKVNSISADVLGKMAEMRVKITNRGIPLILLLTKIDQACNYVGSDLSLVYKSIVIRDIMAMASSKIGIPVSHILPVKNYTLELELDAYVDVLVLSAVQQMLRFTDNYFDECLVHTNAGYVQPEKLSNDVWTRNATVRSNLKQGWTNSSATPITVADNHSSTILQGTGISTSLISGSMELKGAKALAMQNRPERLLNDDAADSNKADDENRVKERANGTTLADLNGSSKISLNDENRNEAIGQAAA